MSPAFPQPRARAGLLAALLFLSQIPAWATPPSHAPAHGWRKQHDPAYMGYTGEKWDKDYGILAGRRPKRSDSGPKTIWPRPMKPMYRVTVAETAA